MDTVILDTNMDAIRITAISNLTLDIAQLMGRRSLNDIFSVNIDRNPNDFCFLTRT